MSDMEANRDQYVRTPEGFLIEDLFQAAIRDGPVYADQQLIVTRTAHPRGLRFAGEIDITNSDAVGPSVRVAFEGAGDAHVDLSALSFCDMSGIRALAEAALELGPGRRILLHGLPEQLRRVMRVTGWTNLGPARGAPARRAAGLRRLRGAIHSFRVRRGRDGAGGQVARRKDRFGAQRDSVLAAPRFTARLFDRDDLLELRRMVGSFATSAGLSAARATELLTAVNEVATNSVDHAGGKGVLRMWRTATAVVCEIRDSGGYRQALPDRVRPGEAPRNPRGLWLANQLCDLVQIRTHPDGTALRLHVNLAS